MRKLLVTTRIIPHEHAAAYETAWSRLLAAVRGAGCNAWRFHHERVAGRYIEFVEWKGAADPTTSAEGMAAVAALDSIARGTTDLWIDAEAMK